MATPTLKLNTTPLQLGQTDMTVFKPVAEDMGILQHSLQMYEQRQNEASENRKELDLTLAKLESQLHQDEKTNQWFSDFKDRMYEDINNSIQTGDYGIALRKAKEYAGKSMVDPGMQGRIRANANYQKAMEEQKARFEQGKISNDTYEWWVADNPYDYNDVYDNKGNVIGGTDWQSKFLPVEDMDFNKLAVVAFTEISPEKDSEANGTTSQGARLAALFDKNGEAKKDKNGVPLIDKLKTTRRYGEYEENSYQRVYLEHIVENMDAIIASTPDGWKKVEQAYKVYQYQIDKLKNQLKSLKNDPTTDPKKIENLQSMIESREVLTLKDGVPLDPNDPMTYRAYATAMIWQSTIAKNEAYDWKTHKKTTENIWDLVNYSGYGKGGSGGGKNKNLSKTEHIKPVKTAAVEGSEQSGIIQLNEANVEFNRRNIIEVGSLFKNKETND